MATSPSFGEVFVIDARTQRRELYSNFQTIDPVIGGKPFYLIHCRDCRFSMTLRRLVGDEVSEGNDAADLIKALDHRKRHTAQPRIEIITSESEKT